MWYKVGCPKKHADSTLSIVMIPQKLLVIPCGVQFPLLELNTKHQPPLQTPLKVGGKKGKKKGENKEEDTVKSLSVLGQIRGQVYLQETCKENVFASSNFQASKNIFLLLFWRRSFVAKTDPVYRSG